MWPPLSGTFVVEQIKALAPHIAITVAVLVPHPPNLSHYHWLRSPLVDKPDGPCRMQELGENISIYYLRYRTIPELGKYLNSRQAWRALRHFLQQQREQFDLIHAHFAYTTGFAAAQAGRSFDLPVVVTAYGSDINFYVKRAPKNLVAALYTIWGLRHATAVTALSKDLATKIAALNISNRQITVIPLGIDEKKFFPRGEKLSLRQQLQLPTDGPLFFFVGNWAPVKGLGFLLEAFARVRRQLPEAKLVMIGSGELEPVLKQQAQKLNIDTHTIWVGRKTHAEIPFWMSAADFLVLPSLSEGFGLVVLESLACGTPVIASRVGGVPEILTSADYGIMVSPGDGEALARAMLEAIDKTWDKKKLVDYAHANTWSERTQRLLKVYQSVLEQKA